MKKLFILILIAVFFTTCKTQDDPAKTYEENKNIFIVFTNGKKKQLTFNQSDLYPILLPNNQQIVFVRRQNANGYEASKIMLVNIVDLKESIITDEKPFEDALDGTKDLQRVGNLTLSLDGNDLLFVTEKYVTGSQLVKVNIKTGQWRELFSAETFEILEKDPYRGYFLAGQSDIEDRGRDIYFRLLNDSGKIIKKFSDEQSMKEFKNGLE